MRPGSDTLEDFAWAEQAACRGCSDLFFPPLAERPQARAKREAAAKSICMGCPVVMSCRSYGRAHLEYGIWGGENEEERVQAGFPLHAPIGMRRVPVRSRAAG